MPRTPELPAELHAEPKRHRRVRITVVNGDSEVPPLPDGARSVGALARRTWESYWKSGLGQFSVAGADDDILREWLLLIDEREKLRKVILDGVKSGKKVPPFIISRMSNVERNIMKVRQELGMTPMARFRLQLSVRASLQQHEALPALPAAPSDDVADAEFDDAPEPWQP